MVAAGLGAGGVGGVSAWGSIGLPQRGRPKPPDPDFSRTLIPGEATPQPGSSLAAMPYAGSLPSDEMAAADAPSAALARPSQQQALATGGFSNSNMRLLAWRPLDLPLRRRSSV